MRKLKQVTRFEGLKRLMKLADYVEKQPREHFDMAAWYIHDDDSHDHGIKDGQPLSPRHVSACGTKACALGHFAASPAGRRLGLSLVYHKAIEYGAYATILMKGGPSDPFEIAQAVFAIDEGDAQYLFDSDGTPMTPKQWAKHCRDFVNYGR